jgi:3-oxoacyl-[acyl-carrier-protein] synthase II
MCATTTKQTSTPSPFDKHRDGLALSEGACSFVIESLEHAERRGAPIVCEIVGFGTNSDGKHATNPCPETMAEALRLSLADAKLAPEDIGLVHAHATGTEIGDIAESRAVHAVFGSQTPVTALKGHFGHSLGATGALEAWCTIEMMRDKVIVPILNLRELDPACAELAYVTSTPTPINCSHVMNNNFAFGGVNTSLIFRRWQ